jgi:hypothetical protein
VATPTLGNTPTTIEDCEATTGWTFLSIALDTDQVKENTYSVLGILRNDLSTAIYDITSDSGSSIDLTGEHFRVWINFAALAFLDTEANNGMELIMGDASNLAYWVVFGSDTYGGGWKNVVIDCDSTPDSGSWSKTAATRWGFRFNRTAAPANKDNTWIDYLRYGDGYYATGGTSGDEIDLAGILAQDIASGYGILDQEEGVYFAYGELQIGNGTTTTWFEMLGEVLVFTDSPVATGLYQLRGQGSGCRVNIVNTVIRSSGTGDATRFIFDMDDADIVSMSITGSFLTRAGESRFKSGQTVTGNTFLDCGQILAAGADFDGSAIVGYEGTANTSALVWTPNTDPNGLLDNMYFEMGTNLTHAIEFGTSSPLTMTLTGIDFSGYNASNNVNDSTLHIKRTSGTVTINLSGCSGNISYRTDGATVNLVADPVVTQITVRDANTQAVIEDARVLLVASDGTGDFPYQESVTIARSGSTATVTHTGHGMATNDFALIEGANQDEYNGTWQITWVSANSYSYTVPGTPTTPATGTITATGGFFNTETNASGIVTDSRTLTVDQPVVGRVRLSTSPSYYRTATITGTVDKDTGFVAIVQLIPDD